MTTKRTKKSLSDAGFKAWATRRRNQRAQAKAQAQRKIKRLEHSRSVRPVKSAAGARKSAAARRRSVRMGAPEVNLTTPPPEKEPT